MQEERGGEGEREGREKKSLASERDTFETRELKEKLQQERKPKAGAFTFKQNRRRGEGGREGEMEHEIDALA